MLVLSLCSFSFFGDYWKETELGKVRDGVDCCRVFEESDLIAIFSEDRDLCLRLFSRQLEDNLQLSGAQEMNSHGTTKYRIINVIA